MSSTSASTTNASTGDVTGPAIDAWRARIDDIDATVVALLAERVRLSAEVQQARLAAGGPRIVHRREVEVVSRYRDALGRAGGSVALAVLEMSRGQIATSPVPR